MPLKTSFLYSLKLKVILMFLCFVSIAACNDKEKSSGGSASADDGGKKEAALGTVDKESLKDGESYTITLTLGENMEQAFGFEKGTNVDRAVYFLDKNEYRFSLAVEDETLFNKIKGMKKATSYKVTFVHKKGSARLSPIGYLKAIE